ncbi:MAG: hypothetical protein KAR08_11530 [Candidatus Heimdallarchaeota archaeon]|jgi:hypothetical protein|nr:hypothetical protein [Candidatus Heimdallarchaeota archaeon]
MKDECIHCGEIIPSTQNHFMHLSDEHGIYLANQEAIKDHFIDSERHEKEITNKNTKIILNTDLSKEDRKKALKLFQAELNKHNHKQKGYEKPNIFRFLLGMLISIGIPFALWLIQYYFTRSTEPPATGWEINY